MSKQTLPCGHRSASQELTFAEFSRINRQRCESKDGFNHLLSSWSRSDWFTAVLGELGEAANIAKKLNRTRDGIPGNKASKEELAVKLRQELGDTFVYLDLLAQACGISIGDAAVEVFNVKSQELKCSIMMLAAEQDVRSCLEDKPESIESQIVGELLTRLHKQGLFQTDGMSDEAIAFTRENLNIGVRLCLPRR